MTPQTVLRAVDSNSKVLLAKGARILKLDGRKKKPWLKTLRGIHSEVAPAIEFVLDGVKLPLDPGQWGVAPFPVAVAAANTVMVRVRTAMVDSNGEDIRRLLAVVQAGAAHDKTGRHP